MPEGSVLIDGREVPVTELAAFYARKSQIEAEQQRQQEALQAANQQIAASQQAVDAIERAKSDPAFARNFVDTLAQVHQGSAFFEDAGTLQQPSGDGTTEPVIPATTTPPGAPAPPAPNGTPIPAPVDPRLIAQAQEIETLRRDLDEDRARRMLEDRKAELAEKFPHLKVDDILKSTIERQVGIEHMDLVAADLERARLQGVLDEKSKNSSILEEMFGVSTPDDALSAIGASVSVGQIDGTSEIDDADLADTGNAIALAAAQLDRSRQTV